VVIYRVFIMKTKTRIIFICAIIFLFGAAAFGIPNERNSGGVIFKKVTNFEECVAGNNSILESYPRQCRSKTGELFTEHVGNIVEKSDLIRISTPQPNTVLTSPFTITGEARGVWFFEASFPVLLTDWDGRIIAEGYAQVKGDPLDSKASWMTEEFIPFETEMTFSKPAYGERGTLILKKDNPSGLPEHDDALEIPVFFAQ